MPTDRSSGSSGGKPAVEDGDFPASLGERERYVLYCLAEHRILALRDLADEVIVWERGTWLPDVPPDERRKLYLSLYHTHVPRLERAGLVEMESDQELVALTDAAVGITCREPAPPTSE